MKNKCGYNKKDLQLIRNFIKEIDEGIVLRIAPNQEFYCQLPLGKIYLGKKKINDIQFYWYDWYQEQEFFSKEEINLRMITLLHEIGHFVTFDLNEWLDRNKKVPQLTEKYCKGQMTLKELNFAYWNLPNEYKATEWAINYYQKHKEKCDLLAEQIGFIYVFENE